MRISKNAETESIGTASQMLAEDITGCLDVLSQLTPRDLRSIPAQTLVRGLAQVQCYDSTHANASVSAVNAREPLHLLDDVFFAALTTEQALAIERHGGHGTFHFLHEHALRDRLSSTITPAARARRRMSAAQVVHFLAHLGDQPPSALNAFFEVYGDRISPEVRNRILSTRSLMAWARTTTRPSPLQDE